MMYGDEKGIRAAEDLVYRVERTSNNLGAEIRITKDILERVSSVEGLQLFGLGLDRSPERIASTWPRQWLYLDTNALGNINSIGFPVDNPHIFLVIGLRIREFGKYAYAETDINRFFDAWIDILAFEYIIQV